MPSMLLDYYRILQRCCSTFDQPGRLRSQFKNDNVKLHLSNICWENEQKSVRSFILWFITCISFYTPLWLTRLSDNMSPDSPNTPWAKCGKINYARLFCGVQRVYPDVNAWGYYGHAHCQSTFSIISFSSCKLIH